MKIIKLDPSLIKLNKDNPRKGTNAIALKDLAKSIAAIGIIQPPTVTKLSDGEYQTVVGNRRVQAAQIAKLPIIDCLLREMNTFDIAVAAISENTKRLDMHPMDHFEAFVELKKQGAETKTIAKQFGVTENIVNRRLQLGELIPAIRKEFREGKVSLEACMLLTTANKETQKTFLKLDKWKRADDLWSIKSLLSEQRCSLEDAIFNIADYKGPIIMDLFGDPDHPGYAEDREEFLELQTLAVELKIKKDKKKYLFSYLSGIRSHEIKTIDGKKINYQWFGNEKKMKADERKKYGIIYYIEPRSYAVDSTFGFTYAEEKKTNAKTSLDEKNEASMTARQKEIYSAVINVSFLQNTTRETAFDFWLGKHDIKEADKLSAKEKTETFSKRIIHLYTDHRIPDRDVANAITKNKWDIRASWTPDAEFLKGYRQATLIEIAKETKINLSKCQTKTAKVEALALAFKENKANTKKWLPK